MFSILHIGILFLGGKSSRFLFVPRYSYKRCVFISIRISSLIGCAGSVGISLAGRVMYIFCACISPL